MLRVGFWREVDRRRSGERVGDAEHVNAAGPAARERGQCLQERRAERRAKISRRQLRRHPVRLHIGEDDRMRGESPDARVARRWLRQDRHAAVCGRELALGSVPQQRGELILRKLIQKGLLVRTWQAGLDGLSRFSSPVQLSRSTAMAHRGSKKTRAGP